MKLAPLLILTLSLFISGLSAQESTFPEGSAENDALKMAAPYSQKNPGFTLRQDYWRGQLTATRGTAFRLQFFKGNTYRMFFAIRKDELPKGAVLHLYVVDSRNRQLAHGESDGENVVELNYKAKKTTQYLVLMRIAIPDGTDTEKNYDGLMIYGWE